MAAQPDAAVREAASEHTWRRCTTCSSVRRHSPPFTAWCPDCQQVHGGGE